MTKFFLAFLAVAFISVSTVLAVDPPPIDGDPDPIPVDGGASLLLASGAVYGFRKLKAKRSK